MLESPSPVTPLSPSPVRLEKSSVAWIYPQNPVCETDTSSRMLTELPCRTVMAKCWSGRSSHLQTHTPARTGYASPWVWNREVIPWASKEVVLPPELRLRYSSPSSSGISQGARASADRAALATSGSTDRWDHALISTAVLNKGIKLFLSALQTWGLLYRKLAAKLSAHKACFRMQALLPPRRELPFRCAKLPGDPVHLCVGMDRCTYGDQQTIMPALPSATKDIAFPIYF